MHACSGAEFLGSPRLSPWSCPLSLCYFTYLWSPLLKQYESVSHQPITIYNTSQFVPLFADGILIFIPKNMLCNFH